MKFPEFTKALKEYYGDYERIVEKVLAEYLIYRFEEKELEKLFKLITDNYSNIYKMPPDKAKIIEIIEKHNDSSVCYWNPSHKIEYKKINKDKKLITKASDYYNNNMIERVKNDNV